MYRLNKKGIFNVPYGGGDRTPEPLWRDNLLINCQRSLKKAKLINCDFEELLSKASENDFVYCDPTYTTAHNNNGFIRYNEQNFSWADQKRLSAICKKIAQKGATVVVSNAYHYDLKKLYKGAQLYVFDRNSLLCPIPSKRGKTKEFLFVFTSK